MRHLIERCALEIVQARVMPEDGAAVLENVRNELVALADSLEGFVGLEAEREIAGDRRTNQSAVDAIEREILSRAETLRRDLERTS